MQTANGISTERISGQLTENRTVVIFTAQSFLLYNVNSTKYHHCRRFVQHYYYVVNVYLHVLHARQGEFTHLPIIANISMSHFVSKT